MKKLLLASILAFSAFAFTAKAQNVQVLYDEGRDCITTTVEMFRPDSFGSTYFFADMDYDPRMQGAYWEISREFCFWQGTKMDWLSLHVEHNGGFSVDPKSATQPFTLFNNCWLGGLTYSGHSKDYSKTWSLSALYKAIPGTIGLNGESDVHNFQITGVWGINFLWGWCTFSGFIDFWREARPWQGTQFIFLSEPQFWVNLSKIRGWDVVNLSVGGEVEISNNFIGKGFEAIPAMGFKWTF